MDFSSKNFLMKKMYVYFVAIVNYVPNNEEDTTTKHIEKICLTTTSISRALELIYGYNFDERVTWITNDSPETTANYFRKTRSFEKQLGYLPANEKGQITRYLELHQTETN